MFSAQETTDNPSYISISHNTPTVGFSNTGLTGDTLLRHAPSGSNMTDPPPGGGEGEGDDYEEMEEPTYEVLSVPA